MFWKIKMSYTKKIFSIRKKKYEKFCKSKRSNYICSNNLRKKMRRPDIVKQISQTIHKMEPMATTLLYGSEARGDASPNSDIDLLILLDGDRRDLKRENALSGELYEIELKSGVQISPMIMLKTQWENRPFKTPFYLNVMNEGVRL